MIHNTALYELLHLAVLFVLLWWLLRRPERVPPGSAIGLFALWYGVARLGTDFLRAYDPTYGGLTAAQWMCLGLVAVGALILARGPARVRRLGPAPAAEVSSREGQTEAADLRVT